MKLESYLRSDRMLTSLDASSVEELMRRLVETLAVSGVALNVPEVVDILMEREYTCSTGVGHWLAIPHATVDGLSETVMAVATMRSQLDYHAIDGQPVKLVFLLLSPQESVSEHLRLLARIARICADEDVIERLAQAPSREALHRELMEEDARHVG